MALVHDLPVQHTRIGSVELWLDDALKCYPVWARPTVIISDGPYGVGGYPGDPPTTTGLREFYAPHAAAWAAAAMPDTTLWFWGTEVGWATVHSLLDEHGWDYRSAHIWDKGKAHIAGNVNGNTIRRYPVVTEVCVQYTRRVLLPTVGNRQLPMKEWLRHEWVRSGLPLYKTNEAAGVKNAATRKYFTQDHLWYYPPPAMMERLVAYANEHGEPTDRPYFSVDGRRPVTTEEWSRYRAKWNYSHGITNVWSEPAVRGIERIRDERAKIAHANQKPLLLMERCVTASSNEGDVVWEPFGGLCTGSVAALRTGRRAYAAEVVSDFYEMAEARLREEEDGRAIATG